MILNGLKREKIFVIADEVVVDLIFKTCGETYETLQGYSETINLDGIPVKTLNLEGLLKTKQSLRDKDMIDRIVLERALAAIKIKNDDGS